MLEETHFSEIELFMAENVLKIVHKEQISHSFPTIVNLPSGVQRVANFFLVFLPKILKSHKLPIVYVPPLSTSKGMLVPLQVNLHDVRPTKAPAIAIAIIEAKKDKIVHENAEMDSTNSLALKKVLTLARQKKPLTLGSHSQSPSKAFTLEHKKGPLTLEPYIKSSSKVLTL